MHLKPQLSPTFLQICAPRYARAIARDEFKTCPFLSTRLSRQLDDQKAISLHFTRPLSQWVNMLIRLDSYFKSMGKHVVWDIICNHRLD